jgi:hypothetical protein
MTVDAASLGEIPSPGLWPDVEEHIYRSWDAINQSSLWGMRRTPAHARHDFLNPGSTPAMDVGTAIHSVVLEPNDLETRYTIRPPGIDGRTKEGKAALAQWRAEAGDRIVLDKPDVMQTLEGIRDAVLDHPIALELLTSRGLTEISAAWDEPLTGARCKGRWDRLVEYDGWPCIVDVKSTDDASPRKFLQSVANYGYSAQAAFYLDGASVLDPKSAEAFRFLFLVVEKKPPYGIAIYELDRVWMDYGRQQYQRYLDDWIECEKTGLWPGYPLHVETLEAPEWAAKQVEYGNE